MPQRKTGRDFVDVFGHQKTDRKDKIVFFVGQDGEIGLIVGGRLRLQNGGVGAQTRLGGIEPSRGRIIKRTIAQTADISHHAEARRTAVGNRLVMRAAHK